MRLGLGSGSGTYTGCMTLRSSNLALEQLCLATLSNITATGIEPGALAQETKMIYFRPWQSQSIGTKSELILIYLGLKVIS